jgi:hypothetical protein
MQSSHPLSKSPLQALSMPLQGPLLTRFNILSQIYQNPSKNAALASFVASEFFLFYPSTGVIGNSVCYFMDHARKLL